MSPWGFFTPLPAVSSPPTADSGAQGFTLGRGLGLGGHSRCLSLCLSPVPLHPAKVYLRDSFGLKTLFARGAIVRCPMAGIAHTAWHSNHTLYETCIEPWLS